MSLINEKPRVEVKEKSFIAILILFLVLGLYIRLTNGSYCSRIAPNDPNQVGFVRKMFSSTSRIGIKKKASQTVNFSPRKVPLSEHT